MKENEFNSGGSIHGKTCGKTFPSLTSQRTDSLSSYLFQQNPPSGSDDVSGSYEDSRKQ